ncbi:hypothetical protein [Streptomyces sp. DH12]|uniref:PAS domain-containing protein n=1 Tax=Streptomyces sp. DH12 TaxID=2857010 RepID=UPI001E3B0117|nr:hypothetical protein [Streptomyces sp. DH12]
MAVYRRLVDSSSFPSIVTDYSSENLHVNEAFRRFFGHVTPHAFASPMQNGTKYILFHPEASSFLGAGDYASFREYWLMPALANLLAGWQQRPGDPKLLQTLQEIKRRPKLLRAYEATPDWIRRSGDIHVNSDARPFQDPRTGKVRTLHIVTEGHQAYQPIALSHVTFVLNDGPEP